MKTETNAKKQAFLFASKNKSFQLSRDTQKNNSNNAKNVLLRKCFSLVYLASPLKTY